MFSQNQENSENLGAKTNQSNSQSYLNNIQLFQSSNGLTDSINKDTIIDQMQEKIGDLLRVNEQLNNVNNQYEKQKEQYILLQNKYEKDSQSSQQRISKLEEESAEKSDIIDSLKHEISNLNDNKQELNHTISSLRQQIEQIQKDSAIEIKKQVQWQTAELKTSLDIKQKEVQDLIDQNNQLKSQLSAHDETISKSRIENQELLIIKNEKERENDQIKSEIVKLRNKLSIIKQKQQKESEQYQKKLLELNSFQFEIANLKQKEALCKEKIKRLNGNLIEANNVIQKLLSIEGGFNSPDKLIEFVQNKNKTVNTLQKEIKSQRKTLKKFALAIQKYEQKLTSLQTNLSASKSQNKELAGKCEEQTNQIESLTATNEKYKQKLVFVQVYENIVNELRRRIAEIVDTVNATEKIESTNEYEDALRMNTKEIKLHHLIITIIMFKRWKSLPGFTPRVYVKDSRNWWWMRSRDKLTGIHVVALIAALRDNIKREKSKISDLKSQIQSLENDIESIKNERQTNEQEFKSKLDQIAELENELEYIKHINKDKVALEVYNELSEKMESKKKKLTSTKSKLKEKEVEVSKLQESLNKAQQDYNNQCLQTKQRELSLEDLKYQLYTCQNNLNNLQQSNEMKTKDILALERVNRKERKGRTAAQTQNTVLSVENKRLNFQVSRQNRQASNLTNANSGMPSSSPHTPERPSVDFTPK